MHQGFATSRRNFVKLAVLGAGAAVLPPGITLAASVGSARIETDDLLIGLMGFLSVSMAEVSANDITVYLGGHHREGEG